MKMTMMARIGATLSLYLSMAIGQAAARCDAPDAAFGEHASDEAVAAATAAAAELRTAHGLPGLSVSVQHRDHGLLWSAAFGEAWVETGTCMARESVLPLGSVSKLVTAAVVARLIEHGAVAADADLRTLLPAAEALPEPVTIEQLLGHLGGIRHYQREDFDFSQPGGIIDLRLYPDTASALAIFIDDPLVALPGERYAYSTFAYTLIAAALEAATGKPFLALIESEVAEPLGLASLQGDTLRRIVPRRAGRYERDDDGDLVKAWPANVAYKWAGGGLISTADDLARFGLAHARPGFLLEDTIQQMTTSQHTADGEATGVGWAWRVGEDESARRVWHHAGAIGGGRAILVVWPDAGLAVAVQTNLTRTPGDIRTFAQTLGGLFLADP